MTLTAHADRQARQRGVDPAGVAAVVRAKLEAHGLRGRDDVAVAVRLARLREHRGGLVGSNGDELWAVVRDGVVTTVMLRRADQPASPQALRVDYVAR